MHGAHTLADGREIVLCELRQWFTHEGVLEGRPSPDMNGHRLKNLVERHQQEGRGAFLCLDGIDAGQISEAFAYGRPAMLPAITCMARFVSYAPTHGSDMMCSELTVIWFQNEFWRQSAFDAAISSIDWERDAWDYDI